MLRSIAFFTETERLEFILSGIGIRRRYKYICEMFERLFMQSVLQNKKVVQFFILFCG